jgi:hypothetical protein
MDWKLKLQVIWDNWLDVWERWKNEMGLTLGMFETVVGFAYGQPFSVAAGIFLIALTFDTVCQKLDM